MAISPIDIRIVGQNDPLDRCTTFKSSMEELNYEWSLVDEAEKMDKCSHAMIN